MFVLFGFKNYFLGFFAGLNCFRDVVFLGLSMELCYAISENLGPLCCPENEKLTKNCLSFALKQANIHFMSNSLLKPDQQVNFVVLEFLEEFLWNFNFGGWEWLVLGHPLRSAVL